MEMMQSVDWETRQANNPYAEWYMNTLRIQDSPTAKYHAEHYGNDFDYLEFADTFREEVQKWDPNVWADLFHEVGARYVVLTTKHHDGFTLWPSKVKHPHRREDLQGASRDLVGELTEAVRTKGMRMGLYYSGGLDWGFTQEPIRSIMEMKVPQSKEYAQFVAAHWRELIERYQPAILWNDIGFPKVGNAHEIFAEYFNQYPDGLVNNRWFSDFGELMQVMMGKGKPSVFYDFDTPEYSKKPDISEKKWETCRGLGQSFGYNRREGSQDHLSEKELVHLLIDIVSKNGNLLINVGPMADGTIPEIQVNLLKAMGVWLDVNGEAIFETRPWTRAEGATTDGIPLRFTKKDEFLYAIFLERPTGSSVKLESIQAASGSQVSWIGTDGIAEWKQDGDNLTVTIPDDLPEAHAYTLKISAM